MSRRKKENGVKNLTKSEKYVSKNLDIYVKKWLQSKMTCAILQSMTKMSKA